MSFKETWIDAEKKLPPEYLRDFVTVDWRVFARRVEKEEGQFVQAFVDSLYSGDAWIFKGAFPYEFIDSLKAKASAWAKSCEPSFHKMLNGCPDFHRKIDIETGKKYSIKGCKHSAYFFRWNTDPLGIWSEISERWRVLKVAMGLRSTEFEFNLPSDGLTDRIQVVRYPPSIGYLEPHIDGYKYQRCIISGYLSKRGVDYQGGGFYFVGKNGEKVDAEDLFDVGDLCIAYATLPHGVAPCDLGTEPDWDGTDGRWFLGLYSNVSDYETSRHTSTPFNMKIEGVIPEGA